MRRSKFDKYFEWIGDTIYIKYQGRPTATKLSSLLDWWEDQQFKLVTLDRQLDSMHDNSVGAADDLQLLLDHLGLQITEKRRVITKKGKK